MKKAYVRLLSVVATVARYTMTNPKKTASKKVVLKHAGAKMFAWFMAGFVLSCTGIVLGNNLSSNDHEQHQHCHSSTTTLVPAVVVNNTTVQYSQPSCSPSSSTLLFEKYILHPDGTEEYTWLMECR